MSTTTDEINKPHTIETVMCYNFNGSPVYCDTCGGLIGGTFTGTVGFCKCKDYDWLRKRLENQLRIHWKWLQNLDHNHLCNFIMAIVENNNVNCDEQQNQKEQTK